MSTSADVLWLADLQVCRIPAVVDLMGQARTSAAHSMLDWCFSMSSQGGVDLDKHVNILGILYIIYGILGLLPAGVVLLFVAGPGMLSGDPTAMLVTSAVATFICSILIVTSVPHIIAGIWLMKYKQWARYLAIALGILNLIAVPFGTALGIYTLWALTNKEMSEIFEGNGSSTVAVKTE